MSWWMSTDLLVVHFISIANGKCKCLTWAINPIQADFPNSMYFQMLLEKRCINITTRSDPGCPIALANICDPLWFTNVLWIYKPHGPKGIGIDWSLPEKKLCLFYSSENTEKNAEMKCLQISICHITGMNFIKKKQKKTVILNCNNILHY